MVYAANYLFSSRAGSWIGAPDRLVGGDRQRPRSLAVAQIGSDGVVLVVLRRWEGCAVCLGRGRFCSIEAV